MKNWYCKPASKEEAIEIVERAVANGARASDLVKGMGGGVERYYWNEYAHWGVLDGYTYTNGTERWRNSEQLTIQQVREQFPLPHEVKVMSDKKEWQGMQDGFPPVGTVCEVLCPDNEWYKTFIVGTDDDGYVVFTAHESPDFYKYGGTRDAAAFRPLRTEREKWVEQAVIHATKEGYINEELAFFIARKIYDNMIKEAE